MRDSMNQFHFLILGDEPRQTYLAQLLKERGHEVMQAEDYMPGYHDAVLLPVPQTKKYSKLKSHWALSSMLNSENIFQYMVF